MLEVQPLELEPAQLDALRAAVKTELSTALEVHAKREERFAEFLRAYKVQPESERKDFPWPGASNVVVPLVPVTVDSIVSRLQKAIMGSQDFAEVTIKAKEWEGMEKQIRDWINWYVLNAGLKGNLRTIAFDMATYGDSYALPVWVEEKRAYHKYDATGQVVTLDIPEYEGVKWYVCAPQDVVFPNGFDEWKQCPWRAVRRRYTWAELKKKEKTGEFEEVVRLRSTAKEREDPTWRVQMENARTTGGSAKLYEVFEIRGLFEIPKLNEEEDEDVFEELILVYSLDADCFLRMIYNPFFGKPHQLVKIPFLHQAHEVQAQGAAEQVIPFQEEASTAHNQKIDAATAANAGIVAVSPDAEFGADQEIYPGCRIVTPNPGKDVAIFHLNEPGPAIQNIEEQAAYQAEKRSGMSSYNLGMESSIVGSQATATGTTALIAEGNIRQWVSIDDMRDALAELLYLTIQLEQQYRPEGYEYIPGIRIQFPQGDVRSSLGLRLKVTSEQVNRDLELQNLQMLMGVLNDYYMRLSQASMMMFNPSIPAPAKQTAFMIMMATQDLIKRFVERFEVENVETLVPNILTIIQGASGAAGPQAGMAGAPGQGPAMAPGAPGAGGGPGVPAAPGGGNFGGSLPMAGGSSLPS
jgi:hypothetical protein